jgi:glycosyltransferase involved in cell wall biosynthesis
MKIAQTSHHYFPHSGGTERVVKTIVDNLVINNNEVHVFSDMDDVSKNRNEKNITYHGVKLKRVSKFRFPESSYWKKIQAESPEILHVQGQRVWSSDYLYTKLQKIKAKKVFTAHGFYQLMYGGAINNIYYNQFMPRFLGKFQKIVCITQHEVDITLKLAPKLRDRITLIGDPVDLVHLEDLSKNKKALEDYELEEGNYIIHAGGLQTNKNIEFIIDGMKDLKLPLILCGNTPNKHYIEKIRNKSKANGVDLKLLGSVPDDVLYPLIKNSKAYVSGSLFEAFGMSMVEACYLGSNVIATNTGVAEELATMGALSIVTKSSEIKAKIEGNDVNKNLDQIKSQIFERYSAENVMGKLQSMYEELNGS